jgi:LysM repeat protein
MEIEKGPGFGRVIFVFLILHAVGIGGFAAYKWLNPDAPAAAASTGPGAASTAAKPKGKLDIDEVLAPRRTTGIPMVVDHPEMPGYKRYRVGEGEKLVEIVRQFHASVAEVEQLNNLKPGTPLFTGQWLTIPDNRAASDLVPSGSEPIRPKVIDDAKTPSPATSTKPKIVQSPPGKAASKTATPEPVSPVLPPPAPAPAPSPSPATPPAAVRVYKVQRGDTAYSIARRYSVDWQDLLRANGLTDPRQLRADQILKIP